MNTLVPIDFTSYPLAAGRRYRLSGFVRGQVTDADALGALIASGFDPSTVKFWPSDLTPAADWPQENLPAASTDEHAFRFEGTRTTSGPFPAAITVGNGSILTFQAWDYVPDLSPVAIITGPLPSPSKAKTTMLYVGIGALFIAGVLGSVALMAGRREPAAAREDAYRYDSTVKHRGVSIHLHKSDGGFCADYRAVSGFVNSPGDVICSDSREGAVNQAKYAIDRLFMHTSAYAFSR